MWTIRREPRRNKAVFSNRSSVEGLQYTKKILSALQCKIVKVSLELLFAQRGNDGDSQGALNFSFCTGA